MSVTTGMSSIGESGHTTLSLCSPSLSNHPIIPANGPQLPASSTASNPETSPTKVLALSVQRTLAHARPLQTHFYTRQMPLQGRGEAFDSLRLAFIALIWKAYYMAAHTRRS